MHLQPGTRRSRWVPGCRGNTLLKSFHLLQLISPADPAAPVWSPVLVSLPSLHSSWEGSRLCPQEVGDLLIPPHVSVNLYRDQSHKGTQVTDHCRFPSLTAAFGPLTDGRPLTVFSITQKAPDLIPSAPPNSDTSKRLTLPFQ